MNTQLGSTNGSLVSYETWLAALASSACIGFTSLVPWLFNLTFFEKHKVSTLQGTQDDGDCRMKYLLSFAIGAILGDIFFHLIPESIESHVTELSNTAETAQRSVGLSIIAGIFMFIIVEMVLEKWSSSYDGEGKEPEEEMLNVDNSRINGLIEPSQRSSNGAVPKSSNNNHYLDLKESFDCIGSINDSNKEIPNENNNNLTTNLNGYSNEELSDHANDDDYNNHVATKPDLILINRKQNNSKTKRLRDDDINRSEPPNKLNYLKTDEKSTCNTDTTAATKANLPIDPAGYLNLIANGFDNFTHGLAIGASFLVGTKVGLLTTFVIFIHEIPHEICDYAILLKSGFSRWEAVKAQSSVSLFGIMGTTLALYVRSIDKINAKTNWILPFSAGGFLYIALVTLLPDILDKDADLRNSLGQIACVTLGIIFMGVVALL